MYVYKFLDKDNNVMYVGNTKDIVSRILNHKNLPEECYDKESQNYNRICVSHGICLSCDKKEIMSNESVEEYKMMGLIS